MHFVRRICRDLSHDPRCRDVVIPPVVQPAGCSLQRRTEALQITSFLDETLYDDAQNSFSTLMTPIPADAGRCKVVEALADSWTIPAKPAFLMPIPLGHRVRAAVWAAQICREGEDAPRKPGHQHPRRRTAGQRFVGDFVPSSCRVRVRSSSSSRR